MAIASASEGEAFLIGSFDVVGWLETVGGVLLLVDGVVLCVGGFVVLPVALFSAAFELSARLLSEDITELSAADCVSSDSAVSDISEDETAVSSGTPEDSAISVLEPLQAERVIDNNKTAVSKLIFLMVKSPRFLDVFYTYFTISQEKHQCCQAL